MQFSRLQLVSVALCVGCLGAVASAGPVKIQVTVTNMAPTNSVSFAPLRVGFNNGTYDSFNNGQAAGQPIISIAEGGSGADWFPDFAANDPTATLGTIVPNPAGPLLPGQTASSIFTVDPSLNRYFTFASMVVPSNDHFIGNDDPMEYMLFDENGNLALNAISVLGLDVWDAGSEVNGVFGAAFLVGSNNDDRIAENGVVSFDFMGLDVFNGALTGGGYLFDRQFGAFDEIYRISFTIVPIPAPGAIALFGLVGIAGPRRRRG